MTRKSIPVRSCTITCLFSFKSVYRNGSAHIMVIIYQILCLYETADFKHLGLNLEGGSVQSSLKPTSPKGVFPGK